MADHIDLIVEGNGEVKAAPLLVRRILHEQLQRYDLRLNVYTARGNGNLTRKGGLEKFLELSRRDSACKAILVLIDAEDDHVQCPVTFARELAQRAQVLRLHKPVAIVCAVCEYESWFLYNLPVIAPKYLQKPNVRYDGNPEQECSAKGWLNRNMPPGRAYKETIDQEKMTALIDLEVTLHASRSFRRLSHAVEQLLHAIDVGKTDVTPLPITS